VTALQAPIGHCRVAVYGTLRRGGINAHLLAGSTFLGIDFTADILLYDLGEYPGAKAGPSAGIEIEVYQIDAQTLLALDLLEEFDPADPARSLYVRQELPTVFGQAWVYLYQGSVVGREAINEGRWLAPNVNPSSAAKPDFAGNSR